MTDEKVKTEEQAATQIEDLPVTEANTDEVKGGVPGGGIWISPGSH